MRAISNQIFRNHEPLYSFSERRLLRNKAVPIHKNQSYRILCLKIFRFLDPKRCRTQIAFGGSPYPQSRFQHYDDTDAVESVDGKNF
jgi:hypothetical protein